MAIPSYVDLMGIVTQTDIDTATVIANIETAMADPAKVRSGYRLVNNKSSFHFHEMGHLTDNELVRDFVKRLEEAGFKVEELGNIVGYMPPNNQDRIFQVSGEGHPGTKWVRLIVSKK